MTPIRLCRVLAATLLCLAALVAAARAADPPYILVDIGTGQVLAERQSGELWYPASLTKLMTIYLLFQALSEDRLQLNSPVTISERATSMQPSRMGFAAGTVITVENAVLMLIVKSANDVAVAVAEMLGGSEAAFVAEMNRTATRLGLTATRFANPHGLPGDGQYSTARDFALLARALWLGFPQFQHFFAVSEIRYGGTIMPTGNSLLEFYPGTNGLKSGYICAAGFNLVATATRGGRTLAAVVLGAASPLERAALAANLLDAGFAAPAVVSAQSISNFLPRSTVAAPVSQRAAICPTGTGLTDEGVQRALLVATFGEPGPLPPPVTVFTGGADMTAYLRVFLPLPQPRPADALGLAGPAADAAGPPLPRARPDRF